MYWNNFLDSAIHAVIEPNFPLTSNRYFTTFVIIIVRFVSEIIIWDTFCFLKKKLELCVNTYMYVAFQNRARNPMAFPVPTDAVCTWTACVTTTMTVEIGQTSSAANTVRLSFLKTKKWDLFWSIICLRCSSLSGNVLYPSCHASVPSLPCRTTGLPICCVLQNVSITREGVTLVIAYQRACGVMGMMTVAICRMKQATVVSDTSHSLFGRKA